MWLPRWPTDRLRRRQPIPSDWPLVAVAEFGGRALVTAADSLAAAGGVLPGASLADARALLPGLATLPADPAGDAAELARLADWCGRYSPLVALDGADGLWIDITGAAHLFGGEAALIADLRHRLAARGHDARAAIADTPGAAWAIARFADGPETILSSGRLAAALAELPVSALRLPPTMAAELERLGLRRIADLYPLPRASLARRFGLLPGERLDQALGRAEEPISPRLPAPAYVVRRVLAEPTLEADGIAAVLQRLLGRLCEELAEAGQGARRLDLHCYRVDGRVIRLSVGTSQPAREPRALARLFAERLDRIDPGFGIEAMALAAARVEAMSDLQLVLERGSGERGGGERGSKAGRAGDPLLASFVDRLGNRLGFSRIARAIPRESHLPERAVSRVALDVEAPPARWPDDPGPLRLFNRPEQVEADGDPPEAFLWRRRRHRILKAEGPARIAPEWWRGATGDVRDYWRLEDEEGRRFWLYGEAGGWYLHGLFA